MSRTLVAAAVVAFAPAVLAAQQPDTTDYVIFRGADTVGTERVVRVDVTRKGELIVRGALRPRITTWSTVLDEKGAAALVEATEVETPPDPRMKAKVLHRTRVIFKADSAAVDDLTSNGMLTDVFPTRVGAVPYLNLSVGTLEMAIAKALPAGAERGEVPLFSMAGAQTVVAEARRADGKVTLQVGKVAFDVTLDAAGRITEASVPSQQLRFARR